ncbi:MAG: hypothetical protein HRT89_05475, partial [Lentisphaeria bacterium]|nr:hypothetical protein [Lentisphaeria bacterium]
IDLLPALPDAWNSGSVRGLVLRGGLTIDIEWEDGVLKSATLHASHDCDIPLVYGHQRKEFSLKAGEEIDITW